MILKSIPMHFYGQNITGETLIDSYQAGTLPDDLKEVGLHALGDRNRVIRFVKQSIEQENLAPVTVEPEIQIQTKQDTQKTITGFFKSVPKDQFLLSFPSTSSKIPQRYKHRPRFFEKLHGKFATDGGAEYRAWLKTECTEGRENEIPRDPEEISRLNKFRKRVKEIKVNIHLSEKKVIAGYEAGKHFKAEDEWTIKCEVCKNLFHCREVIRVDAAISHVFFPSHMKRLSQEEGFELPSHPLELEKLCRTAYEERNHAFSPGDNSDPSSMKVTFSSSHNPSSTSSVTKKRILATDSEKECKRRKIEEMISTRKSIAAMLGLNVDARS